MIYQLKKRRIDEGGTYELVDIVDGSWRTGGGSRKMYRQLLGNDDTCGFWSSWRA